VTSPEKPEAREGSAAPDGKPVDSSTVITGQAAAGSQAAASGAHDSNAARPAAAGPGAGAGGPGAGGAGGAGVGGAAPAGPYARPDAPTVQQYRPKQDNSPPPWQRVVSDSAAVEPAHEPPTSRFEDWGYRKGDPRAAAAGIPPASAGVPPECPSPAAPR